MNIAVRSNWAVRVLLAEGVESVELYSRSLSPETLYLAVHCEDLDSSVSVELQQQGEGRLQARWCGSEERGCKQGGVVVERVPSPKPPILLPAERSVSFGPQRMGKGGLQAGVVLLGWKRKRVLGVEHQDGLNPSTSSIIPPTLTI